MPVAEREIICLECGQQHPLYGRGLCMTCYGHLRRIGRLEKEYPTQRGKRFVCPECQEDKKLWGLGVCYACYRKRYRQGGTQPNVTPLDAPARQITAAEAWAIVCQALDEFVRGTDHGTILPHDCHA